MELFERIVNYINHGQTPEEIRAAFIGKYTDEVIYLNWVAAKIIVSRQST